MAKEPTNKNLHRTPKDVQEMLSYSAPLLSLWNTLTPLARNEWICWIISVKKSETRREHIHRMSEQLRAGKRRPCCFAGCPHRNKHTTG